MNKGKPKGKADDNHKPNGLLADSATTLSSPEITKSFLPSPSISDTVIIASEDTSVFRIANSFPLIKFKIVCDIPH